MKYCRVCLEPNTRPNSKFSARGICPACEYFQICKKVDWNGRYEKLEEIIKKYKIQKLNHHNCIIGVSGGKDSTRQALWVREKLGLNPLLVCLSYPPQQISTRGADNISNLISLGFDLVSISPGPITWRKLIKEGFFRFSNWARSSELALFASVPQIAIKYNIPLIFWGENPALQVGDLNTLGRSGYDGNNLRNSNTLVSGHKWMLDSGFDINHILPYIYPSLNDFKSANIQIIFLGWFLKDWSLLNNGIFSSLSGLKIRSEGADQTGDLYGISNLDEDWHNLNQMIKYYKFGFGKVTEYVNEEIRSGSISREDAIILVERYDGKCSKQYIQSFCDFIKITENKFWTHIHKNLNKDLFYINPKGVIKNKFKVGVGL